jgi:hypothetical protein
MTLKGIREVDVKKDAKGNYHWVHIVFGPHYFVEHYREQNDKVTFVLGATTTASRLMPQRLVATWRRSSMRFGRLIPTTWWIDNPLNFQGVF